jgi:hypothetical protein
MGLVELGRHRDGAAVAQQRLRGVVRDSIYFDASVPHAYRKSGGKTMQRVDRHDRMTRAWHVDCSSDTRGDATDNINHLLRGTKDAAIALAVKSFFNAKYNRIGRMSEVSVDTARREIRVRLELTGESTPVDIHVTNYSVEQHGERGTVTIGDATASREWMTELLRQLVIGRTFDIPERAAAVLRLLL